MRQKWKSRGLSREDSNCLISNMFYKMVPFVKSTMPSGKVTITDVQAVLWMLDEMEHGYGYSPIRTLNINRILYLVGFKEEEPTEEITEDTLRALEAYCEQIQKTTTNDNNPLTH